jgi:peptidoglycan/LPS O-acetylase OafA/YrhL
VFAILNVEYIFIWLLGAICYYVYVNNIYKPVILNRLIYFIATALILSDLAIKVFFSVESVRIVCELIFAYLFSLTILYLLYNPPITTAAKWLDATGTKLAKFSYTLYLSHYAILQFYASCLDKNDQICIISIIQLLSGVLLSLVIAFLLYLIGERHTYIVKTKIKILWKN